MRTLHWIHRYLGLILGVIWLLQGLTGAIIVFGRDIGHAMADRPAAAFDVPTFGAAIEQLQSAQPGRAVTFVMAADPDSRWFDVLYEDNNGPTRFARVDGQGAVLYDLLFDSGFPSPGLFMTALHWHQTFFGIPEGLTLVGISGIFLLLTILLGLRLAWPQAGRWREVLRPRGNRNAAATLYSWHRALGLWLVLPAVASMIAGILLALGEPVRTLAGGDIDSPVAPAKVAIDAEKPRLADAIRIARGTFPSCELAIVSMPNDETPWYRIRVRQPGEIRRFFGTSVVWVDARDGAVLKTHDALSAKPAVAFFDGLYPFHSGEIAGFGGRLLTLALGLWLMAMAGLGVSLWAKRRRG